LKPSKTLPRCSLWQQSDEEFRRSLWCFISAEQPADRSLIAQNNFPVIPFTTLKPSNKGSEENEAAALRCEMRKGLYTSSKAHLFVAAILR